MKINFEKLIYLDPDFISSIYEEIKNISPTSQFTKTEGMKTDGGIPFLSAGVFSQETKTYKLSSIKMLNEILETIQSKFLSFQDDDFKNGMGSQTVWIEGYLTIGEWRDSKTNLSDEYFEFISNKKNYSFIIQPENFFSNIID